MKTKVLLAVLILIGEFGFSQGFQNLNFEATTVATNDSRKIVPVSEAFPGWTIYKAGVSQTEVLFNTFNGSTSSVALASRYFAAVSSLPSSLGNFSAFFELDPTDSFTIGLGQVGTIAPGIGSLQFQTFRSTALGANSIQAEFNGAPLTVQSLGTVDDVKTWVADVSGLAGQTGELRFSVTPSENAFGFFRLDNLQFTTVPEPSTWAIVCAGLVVWACARRRRA